MALATWLITQWYRLRMTLHEFNCPQPKALYTVCNITPFSTTVIHDGCGKLWVA